MRKNGYYHKLNWKMARESVTKSATVSSKGKGKQREDGRSDVRKQKRFIRTLKKRSALRRKVLAKEVGAHYLEFHPPDGLLLAAVGATIRLLLEDVATNCLNIMYLVAALYIQY